MPNDKGTLAMEHGDVQIPGVDDAPNPLEHIQAARQKIRNILDVAKQTGTPTIAILPRDVVAVCPKCAGFGCDGCDDGLVEGRPPALVYAEECRRIKSCLEHVQEDPEANSLTPAALIASIAFLGNLADTLESGQKAAQDDVQDAIAPAMDFHTLSGLDELLEGLAEMIEELTEGAE